MKKRHRLVLVLALLLLTCGLVGGYVAWTTGSTLVQPFGPPGSPTVPFVVEPGEITT